jgi:hypothetical protein
MAAPVRHLSPRVLAWVGWLVALLMAAALFKEPRSDLGFIAIAGPYAFLAGAWFSYRRISDLLEKNFLGQQAILALLQERLGIAVVFAFVGIGIAMFMGMVIQKSAIH